MPFEVAHRCNGAGIPTYWHVQPAEGTNDKPALAYEAPSLVDALALRNMLNAIHPDLMERAMQDAIPEADAILRSAAE